MGTLRATWPKEELSVEVLKGAIGPGEHPYLGIEVRMVHQRRALTLYGRSCYITVGYRVSPPIRKATIILD